MVIKMRLDKYLSECTGKTRSQVKALVKKGLVTVDGVPAKSPDMKIDETSSAVTMDGKTLSYEKYVYYMLNKPEGYVSATDDNLHKTVIDLLSGENTRDLFPVGRLDIDTVGLLLITNDGALSHDLLSPAKHVAKTYEAILDGIVTDEDITMFKTGVDIGEEKLCKPATLKVVDIDENKGHSRVYITRTEGKFHQIKRMANAIGMDVLFLKRLSMGSLVLDPALSPGEYRRLTEDELNSLRSK